MEKILRDTLALLSLSAKETTFFEACFRIGPATIPEIAKIAKIERSTAYLIANELIAKKLIKEDLSNFKKKYFTVEPKDLARIVAAKQRLLRRQELEILEKLPELQALYKASDLRPKVRIFDGRSGLANILNDITKSQGKEILLWTNQDSEKLFFTEAEHNRFISQRLASKIKIKVLAVDNDLGKKLLFDENRLLRQTKLLPKDFTFSAETYIYDQKIAILDYKKDIIGVIIESEPIFNSQKAIFELVWKLLDK